MKETEMYTIKKIHHFPFLLSKQLEGDPKALGTLVLPGRKEEIEKYLEQEVRCFEWPDHGQGAIRLPNVCTSMVLQGVVKRPVPATHWKLIEGLDEWVVDREAVRNQLPPVASLWAIWYNHIGIHADPEIPDSMKAEYPEGHVLGITIMASPTEECPPPTARTFLKNLAGGNARYLVGGEFEMSRAELAALAGYVRRFDQEYALVG